MFIVTFLCIRGLLTIAFKKSLELSDDNQSLYDVPKIYSFIGAGLFIVGIFLDIIKLSTDVYFIVLGIYAIVTLLIISTQIVVQRKHIIDQREQAQPIYEILQSLVDKKGAGLDYNNIPFKLKHKYGKVQEIDVTIEPTNFNAKNLELYTQQLNAFLPTFNWTYELHLEERHITFIGHDKPPDMARWPGSWLHHFRYMPVGISGDGEIAWKYDSVPKSKMSHSQYKDEHGNFIKLDDSLPTQPQGLVCGAPLSLETIIPTTTGYKSMQDIQVGDYVFGINNTPTKVISTLNAHMSSILYEITFKSNNDVIKIKADDIHRWVVKKDKKVIKHTNELQIGDIIFGLNENYIVKNIQIIPNEDVRCILISDQNHMFLITDKKENWNGGNEYIGNAIYTMNTGGGKSIWVEQEIE